MLTHVFFSAPHRVFFAGGVAQLIFALLFWSVELLGRQLGFSIPWSAPATWLHGGFMLFTIFPWFILGFLKTALPKWMGQGPFSRSEYLPAFFFFALGSLAYDLGVVVHGLLSGMGMLSMALGVVLAVRELGRLTLASENGKSHALLVLFALGLGAVGMVSHGLALYRMDADLQAMAILLGLWGFLFPLFFVVLHRMLPFFTSSTLPDRDLWRPLPTLYLMVALLVGHGVLQGLGFNSALVDVLAALLAWYCLVRWGFLHSLKEPMLAMLHLGWFWACLGITAYGIQSLMMATGSAWGGLAPLHALGLGCFLSILLGMGTRVTRGHSGRVIDEDRWGWRCFLILQVGVLLRLLGEFLPLGGITNLVALVATLLACLMWAAIYGPMYLKPRPDGQSG